MSCYYYVVLDDGLVAFTRLRNAINYIADLSIEHNGRKYEVLRGRKHYASYGWDSAAEKCRKYV